MKSGLLSTVALLTVLTVAAPVWANYHALPPKLTVTANTYEGGSHPALKIGMSNFRSGFERLKLDAPAGTVFNPKRQSLCAIGLFREVPSVIEASARNRAARDRGEGIAPEFAPDAFQETGAVSARCPEDSQIGSIAVGGAGNTILHAIIDHQINTNCDDWYERIGSWLKYGEGCIYRVFTLAKRKLRKSLVLSVMNHLRGKVFNCDDLAAGGAFSKLCVEIETLPDDALVERLNPDDPESAAKLQKKIKDLTKAMGRDDLPSIYLRFTCDSFIRDGENEDLGMRLDCDLPERYMWLASSLSLTLDGNLGTQSSKHLLTLPTSCGDKAFSARFYQGGDPIDVTHSKIAGPGGSDPEQLIDPWQNLSCELPFDPEINLETSINELGGKPDLSLTVNNRYGSSHLREAELALPSAFSLDRLNAEACPQVNLEDAHTCQSESEVGEMEIETPIRTVKAPLFLLRGPADGSRFMVAPVRSYFSNNFTVTARIIDRKVNLNLGGLHQYPFDRITIKLHGGDRGLLRAGQYCGQYRTAAKFSDFNGRLTRPDQLFTLDAGCTGTDPDQPDPEITRDPNNPNPEDLPQPDPRSLGRWADPKGCNPACPVNEAEGEDATFPTIAEWKQKPVISFTQELGVHAEEWSSRRSAVAEVFTEDDWQLIGGRGRLSHPYSNRRSLAERTQIAVFDDDLHLVVSKRPDDLALSGSVDGYEWRPSSEQWQRTYRFGLESGGDRYTGGDFWQVDVDQINESKLYTFDQRTQDHRGSYIDVCDHSCQKVRLFGQTELGSEQNSEAPSTATSDRAAVSIFSHTDLFSNIWVTSSDQGKSRLNIHPHHEAKGGRVLGAQHRFYAVWRERIDRDSDGPGDGDGNGIGDIWRPYAAVRGSDGWRHIVQAPSRTRGQRKTIYSGSELSSNTFNAPDVTSVHSTLYVAYTVSDAGVQKLRVKRWLDGERYWQQVGGDLNVSQQSSANDPRIASVGGTPYVTWSEVDRNDGVEKVYVKTLFDPDKQNGVPLPSTVASLTQA